MTGLECLKQEMCNRGCSKAQIESKNVAIILDIVANSGDKYSKAWEDEKELKAKIQSLENSRIWAERTLDGLKSRNEEIKYRWSKMKEYIEKFNDALSQCETPEGRDAMKRAQMFVNTVDVDSKYDNTAFIIGLAAILSSGEVGALQELKKINPKLMGLSKL